MPSILIHHKQHPHPHHVKSRTHHIHGSGLMSSARNANDPNAKGASVGFRVAWAMQEHFSNQAKRSPRIAQARIGT